MPHYDVLRVQRVIDPANDLYTYHFSYPSMIRPGLYSEHTSHEQRIIARAAHEDRMVDAATHILRLDDDLHPVPPEGGLLVFSQLGELLRDTYLPSSVVTYLFHSHDPLAIATDDPAFPWELVTHPEHGFLGAYRPISRLPLRQQPDRASPVWSEQRQALIIGDTRGDRPACAEEARWLADQLSTSQPPYSVQDVIGSAAGTKERLLLALHAPCELRHITGHIVAKDEDGVDGICCADGAILTVEELRTHLGSSAYLLFNGCRSGRGGTLRSLEQHGGVLQGLVGVGFEHGACAIIGTLWPIFSQGASDFAQYLYQQLLRGVSFAEALRAARVAWREKRPNDPTWAAYVLYGDPRHTLTTIRDQAQVEALALEHAHRSVNLPFQVFTPQMAPAWLSPRGAAFVRLCIPDDEITLDETAHVALNATLAWLDQQGQRRVRRLDLLMGLATVPDGLIVTALARLGLALDWLRAIVVWSTGTGTGSSPLPALSAGVRHVLKTAAEQALAAGRMQITEADLVTALLGVPARGSLAIVLGRLGCTTAMLLAAATGTPIPDAEPLPPAMFPLLPVMQHQMQRDATPQSLLRNLTTEVSMMPQPFVGRDTEVREVLRVLRQTERHHVILLGPAGVGKDALTLQIATLIVRGADPVRIGLLATYDLLAVRVVRPSPDLPGWFERTLTQLRRPTLLVLEDLPRLLCHAAILPHLIALARHPHVRLLATARAEDYRPLALTQGELATLLVPIELDPPQPELAAQMVRAHVAMLEAFYHVTITVDAVTAAIAATAAERISVLPGVALDRLAWACVLAHQAAEASVTAERVRHTHQEILRISREGVDDV